jgi:hypothetical protein
MKQNRNWIVAIILTVTAGAAAVIQSQVTKNADSTAEPLPITATTEMCAYMWATHDAPELTDKFNAVISGLDKNASANAKFYGEDCVYTDGRSTFGVMETDFYVRLTVSDMKDAEAFGNWMTKVMSVVTQIPRAEIQGNYGFVEFSFIKSEPERLAIRVPIQVYVDQAQGMTGVELFDFFASP